jgi:hypothetical protein
MYVHTYFRQTINDRSCSIGPHRLLMIDERNEARVIMPEKVCQQMQFAPCGGNAELAAGNHLNSARLSARNSLLVSADGIVIGKRNGLETRRCRALDHDSRRILTIRCV